MKYIITLIAIFITIYQSCSSQATYNNKPVTKRDTVFENAFSQIDSNLFYFPTKFFREGSDLPAYKNFRVNWYSKQLIALKEPIIFSDTSTKEIYRFTWLRSFHNPIAIRIERLGNDFKVYWKLCNGAGGYAPGKLIIDRQKVIDKSDWDEFIKLLDQIDYWKLNTIEQTFGTDGAEWIIEGKKLNQYQVVDRWTPNHGSKYYLCCDFLIKLTDLRIAEKYKY